MSQGRLEQQASHVRWVLAAVISLAAGSASAQPTTPAHAGREREPVRFTADEETLWLALVAPNRSHVYSRGVNDGFGPQEPFHAAISSMVALGGVLYVFVDEGAMYSLAPDGWMREFDLPQRRLPLALLGDGSGLYALIRSPAPEEMPRLAGGARCPASQPFDPGAAPLSVARYDSQGWAAVAACPAAMRADGPLPPRLGLIHGTLCLFWVEADGQQIDHVRFDPESGDWRPGGATAAVSDLSGFWVTTVSRVPTIIVAARATDGGEELSAMRLFGGLTESQAEWRRAALRLSALPGGAQPGQYQAAFGFNQHVVLLMLDRQGTSYLRFGRADADPAEVSVPVAEVLERRPESGRPVRWVQGATLVALFVVLLSLFVFRRGAMVTAALLPADCAPALTFQRLIGGLVDLAPFVVAAAALSGVDWRVGLRELLSWAPGSDARGRMPAPRTLWWWGVSCGGYTLYSLVLELIMQRTAGKMLTGTRIMSERGTPPGVAPTVVRNLFRLLELLPPFWLLGFLVVLSRNRQRLGDIFAHTLVVRRMKTASEE